MARVEVEQLGQGPAVVRLTWIGELGPADEDPVRAAVDRAFEAGARRVEALVPVDDVTTRRLLQRVGLRPEGTARGALADGGDARVLARLPEDPRPGTPEGFLAMLNATLPVKRVIAQGLIRDDEGHALVCELTYKPVWDLPGGVVDPHESPVGALAREVAEELGVSLTPSRLLAVDWLPPYKQWDDALLLVLDLGVHPGLPEQMVLQASEIRAVHWVGEADLEAHLAPYAARLVREVLRPEVLAGQVVYLEDGYPTLAGR